LGGPVTGAVEEYDPAADAWRIRAAMAIPPGHLVVAAGPDCIYAIGGRANGDEGDDLAVAAEAYDPTADSWEPLLPCQRRAAASPAPRSARQSTLSAAAPSPTPPKSIRRTKCFSCPTSRFDIRQ
jgi:hypothetical protein